MMFPHPGGIGGAVMLPATEIALGSVGLIMRKHVCLIGVSSDSSWLTYNGTRSAITFPPGMRESCLKHVTVALGSGAGANATSISVQGNFGSDLPTVYLKIQDVSVWAGAVKPSQIGMDLADLSQPQPAPSGVQSSWFDTIKIVNLGQPIVVNGQEGNFWNGIQIDGFSSVAVNEESGDDNFWQLRITGGMASPSAIGFQEAGRMNQVHLTCDFGIGAQTCINELGGGNMWDVNALTPVGTIASSSFFRDVGAMYGGIPSNFQVSSLAITGASSTIRSGTSACLEMGNSDGSAGVNYITVLNGVTSVTTTKPSSCQ
ncbi:MAG: hypothetical protein JOZ29_11255 [Deltaproteobacteria bacterium]|nr:hypothetical protein [Deltaproteobacteria bacterium]